jgi:CRP-like cAMP-binding protein
MEKPRPTRPSPPELPGAESCDGWLDHALTLLLAKETEASLRWGAAVVGRNASPSALLLTSRSLEQMGRGRAAVEGLGLALDRAVYAGNVPLAVAAIEDLRALGVDVREPLDRLATTFCRGSSRLDESLAAPLPLPLEDLQPLSSFLTGPALASTATQILRGATAARAETANVDPPRVGPLPLFSALDREALRNLLAAFEVLTVPAGHRIRSEGEPGTAAYIVARGEVEVSRSQRHGGAPVVVARLGEGAFLGEIPLFSDLPCADTIVATRPSILLVARREALERVTARYPEVAAELAMHGRARLLSNLGRAAPVLAALPSKERALLIERLEMRAFQAGEKLMTGGEEVSGLHLVAAGEVAVVAREGNERVVLATLGAGETLGEVELVLCRRAEADAIALRSTATLFLPRAQFLALAAEHPAIAQGLYLTALRRQAETALAMVAPATVADGDLLEDAAAPAPAPVGAPRVAVAAGPPPSTLPPTSVSTPAASPRRGSFARPAMIGVGAFAAVAAVPLAIVVLLGRHGDSSAASAIEAKNAMVATEATSATATATPLDVRAIQPTSPRPPAVHPPTSALPPRATPSALTGSPLTAAPSPAPTPSPAPRRTSASPVAAASVRPEEFGGRE